jgi:hypothetical protein
MAIRSPLERAPGPDTADAALAKFAQALVRETGVDGCSDEFKRSLIDRLRAEGVEAEGRALAHRLLAARRACVTETLDGG